jgi:altronate dehydratase small subunit
MLVSSIDPKNIALVLHVKDNVAVALTNLARGQKVIIKRDNEELRIILLDDIMFGHKFALEDIPKGGYIIKYGEVIGRATRPIRKGEHVHIHNVVGLRGRGVSEVDIK